MPSYLLSSMPLGFPQQVKSSCGDILGYYWHMSPRVTPAMTWELHQTFSSLNIRLWFDRVSLSRGQILEEEDPLSDELAARRLVRCSGLGGDTLRK